MRVDIEQSHFDIYKKLAGDINNAAARFRIKAHKISPRAYEKLIFSTSISVEKKKKGLARHLHEALVKTFSVDPRKIKSKKELLGGFKNNLMVLRAMVDKLRSINHYLEESFLREIGVTKKTPLPSLKPKKPQKILTKGYLGKKDLESLEHVAYSLIEKVIFLDKKLLEGYKRGEGRIIKEKAVETRHIGDVRKKEAEILRHWEAKLPPPAKVKPALLKNQVMHHWVARIFALLSGFENEYKKESMIFSKLKKNEEIRKKINRKIKHILKEKEKLLRVKEQRALSMKTLKIDNEWRLMFYQFNAAARL